MAYKPLAAVTAEQATLARRTPQVFLAGYMSPRRGRYSKIAHYSLQFNRALFLMADKPREVTMDIDAAARAIKFGDIRRAHYFVWKVNPKNRVVGAARIIHLGMELGHYTLREQLPNGDFIVVREDAPTPDAYDWRRVTRNVNWMARPPELVIYGNGNRHSGLLTRELHELMNFPGALVVEADATTKSLRIRPAVITDPMPIPMHQSKNASFGSARLTQAGLPYGRYRLVEQKDGWWALTWDRGVKDDA